MKVELNSLKLQISIEEIICLIWIIGTLLG